MKVEEWKLYKERHLHENYSAYRFCLELSTEEPIAKIKSFGWHSYEEKEYTGYLYESTGYQQRLKTRYYFDSFEQGLHFFDVLLTDKGYTLDKLFDHKEILDKYYNIHS
tara:strand:- start:290 stop:616 length:327 start_codon:yes stop_codon:yes gene_type:complete